MRRRFGVIGAVGLSLLFAGCSSDESDEAEDDIRAANIASVIPLSPWAVDMRCVSMSAGCPRLNDALRGKNPSNYAYGTSTDTFLGYKDGSRQVWDQVLLRDKNGKVVKNRSRAVIVNKDGKKVTAPQGYVNLIPMLMDTDPLKQVNITKSLEDGDVLVYFHPEDSSGQDLMERRVSHVAMYYNYQNGDTKRVHHIDNPHSYGPEFNHRANRHMPFHVFRYKPGSGIGMGARNWGIITNANSPFADFFELTLQNGGDLKKFAQAAIQGQAIPEVYCSGLAFANLNLAANYPLNQAGLSKIGAWDVFQSREYRFKDTRETLRSNVLGKGSEHLAAPAEDKLIFPPYTPSEMMSAYINVHFSGLPKEQVMVAVQDPRLQAGLRQAFYEVRYSDEARGEKAAEGRPAADAAITPAEVAIWGRAYAATLKDGANATAAFVNDPANTKNGKTLKQYVEDKHIATIGLSPLALIREVERGDATREHRPLYANRFVPPRIWLDMADRNNLDGETVDTGLRYVGTVLNCELLSDPSKPTSNPCSGGGGGAAQFSEGGADTSTYPHYAVRNGSERTHRRFDSTPGPEKLGYGTSIQVRATAPSISDVTFHLHVPAMWKAAEDQLQMSVIDFDRYCTQQMKEGGRGTCGPTEAIVLDPAKAVRSEGVAGTSLNNATLTFYLVGPRGVCEVVNEDTMKCPVVKRKAGTKDGTYASRFEEVQVVEVPRQGRGLISTTMIDKGAEEAGAELPSCAACSSGGAQYNQWVVTIRNDR